uniref:Uncharacterized protein n=1 Tax=Eutreptiella gymnastica TaxID=73025 RepID=A0A7S4G278_9EUGL
MGRPQIWKGVYKAALLFTHCHQPDQRVGAPPPEHCAKAGAAARTHPQPPPLPVGDMCGSPVPCGGGPRLLTPTPSAAHTTVSGNPSNGKGLPLLGRENSTFRKARAASE